MRKIDNRIFYDAVEISEILNQKLSSENIALLLENGELEGPKIDSKWHVSKETADFLVNTIKGRIDENRVYTIDIQEVDLSKTVLEGNIGSKKVKTGYGISWG